MEDLLLQNWKQSVRDEILALVAKIKAKIIDVYHPSLGNVLISYAPGELFDGVQMLERVLAITGLVVQKEEVQNSEILQQHLTDKSQLIIICTPKYASIVTDQPQIRGVIAEFGTRFPDTLYPLLSMGGFGDTALKIVDKHFLIRSFHGAFSGVGMTPLKTLIDVIIHPSGSQGLGVLPDLLDLEKKTSENAFAEYKKLFDEFDEGHKKATREYVLRNHAHKLVQENKLNPFLDEFDPEKEKEEQDAEKKADREKRRLEYKRIEKLITKVLEGKAKTGLVLCPRKADTILTSLILERELLEKKSWLLLSIDCSEFLGRASHCCVELSLRNLKISKPDIAALKNSEIIILFKGYEQLQAYENLYVKNQLVNWPKAKVFVSCRACHFQFRDHTSCFINDPTNPKLDSLQTLNLKTLTSEDELSTIESIDQSQHLDAGHDNAHDDEVEFFNSVKRSIQRTEMKKFLSKLNMQLVKDGYLQPNIEDNEQGFISYAWEYDSKKLARQQRHLSTIVSDLRRLGFSTWFDIERMTGDIDQQMAGNIKSSNFVLLIGTPNYTQRAAKETNVQKEYLAILKKLGEKELTVYGLQFNNDDPDGTKPFPAQILADLSESLLDFRGIDDETIYMNQMISLENPVGLIPRLLKLTPGNDVTTTSSESTTETRILEYSNLLSFFSKTTRTLGCESGY